MHRAFALDETIGIVSDLLSVFVTCVHLFAGDFVAYTSISTGRITHLFKNHTRMGPSAQLSGIGRERLSMSIEIYTSTSTSIAAEFQLLLIMLRP